MGRYFCRWFADAGYQVRIMGRDGWSDVEALCEGLDLAVISVPIDVTAEVAMRLAPHLPANCVLTDITSIKAPPLQAMLQAPPAIFPTAGIPVLPFEELEGTNDLAVQGQYTDLGMVSGLRFVGRFAQSPTPVTNKGLRYIVQGFAGDANEYLVAAFYPVTTTALPDHATDVPAAELDQLQADPIAYLEEKAKTLNSLSETDWIPSLAILDAVIASLTF